MKNKKMSENLEVKPEVKPETKEELKTEVKPEAKTKKTTGFFESDKSEKPKETKTINFEPKVKEKPKTSQYYKKKKEKEAEKGMFLNSFKGTGTFLLNIICERLPNPKPLSSTESENLDELFSVVLFKHSDLLGAYQEETMLGFVLLGVILPRLKKDTDNDKTG